MQHIEVRYFAAARAATGVGTEQVAVPPGADVDVLRTHLTERHPALRPVLDVASLLVDEVSTRDGRTPLDGVRTVDVLPPFAGG